MSQFRMMGNRPTAGIIVIGDEILSGQTQDCNSPLLCRLLHKYGVSVRKVCAVGDQLSEIVDEVRRFSREYDYVFTTGGIGSTPDDGTFEALAQAFNEPLILHSELKSFVEQLVPDKKKECRDTIAAVEKICRLPASTKLIGLDCAPVISEDGKTYRFPSFQVHNVIALPGAPSLCTQSFLIVAQFLFGYLRVEETDLQPEVNRLSTKVKGDSIKKLSDERFGVDEVPSNSATKECADESNEVAAVLQQEQNELKKQAEATLRTEETQPDYNQPQIQQLSVITEVIPAQKGITNQPQSAQHADSVYEQRLVWARQQAIDAEQEAERLRREQNAALQADSVHEQRMTELRQQATQIERLQAELRARRREQDDTKGRRKDNS